MILLNKFKVAEIRRATGATQGDVSYVKKLLSTVEGREKLMEDKPEWKRASVTMGHIRAVREIMTKSNSLHTSTRDIKVILD